VQGACAATLSPDDPANVAEETDMTTENRYAQSLAAIVVVLAVLTAGILANAGTTVQAYI
jgi:hypothetical protein